MSRNGSGVYTLPAGNPVVAGTTITTTWANNTLSDMATALSGSIAADGQTPITGPLVGSGDTVQFGGTGQITLPAGSTAQRSSSPSVGMIRYNNSLAQFEGYAGSAWSRIGENATNLLGGVAGSIPFQSAPNTTGFSTAGVVGQVLTSNGTGTPYWADRSSALTLISTQTASSVASIQWTGLTGYNSYILTFDNVVPAQNGNYPQVIIGKGTGPTYITSGNSIVGTYQQGGTSVFGRFSANTADISGMSLGAPVFNGTGNFISGTVQFFGILAGQYPTAITQATCNGTALDASNNNINGILATDNSAITAIQFSFSAGIIASGRFSLYGITS